MLIGSFSHIKMWFFQLRRYGNWPPPSLNRKLNRFFFFRKLSSIYLVDSLNARLNFVFQFFHGCRELREHKSVQIFSIERGHTEPILPNMKAIESVLLSQINGLNGLVVITTVQQRHDDAEHHPVEIPCLRDRFKVVETYSIKVFFYSSVQYRFQIRKKFQLFHSVTKLIIS